ncbi:hypothetical protein Rumeso_02529 [Rubellimicrobium mesophilum DSM 19309]|uniref:AB hydrolase-1 domain-containing protein n=1 Tax=Rubellimicrobium mesophilum DSM 19309 TaxID=442562 RepID=A0A017HNG4_9RHOB|nr:alpha/beta hydrolase [Rubellimicrobium mesophilum]EYD75911.1 hypothetical protein Rumeso_02529 [Rubellimicrobium mesophilum DSM 19309]
MRVAGVIELGWFVLLAALLAAASVNTRLLAACAERDYPAGGAFLDVDGVRLHYAEQGGDGPAVVFLHGNPGSLHDFDAVLPLAARQELRAIAFDRPGHGYSERPAGQVDVHEQARLIHDALAQLGVTKPILVAHSWSGALALAYALDHPGEVRGLVLLAPVAYGSQRFGSGLEQATQVPVLGTILAWTVIAPLAGKIVPGILTVAYAPDRVPEDYAAAALAMWMRPGAFLAWAQDMDLLQDELNGMSPSYGSIAAPVQIVLGELDGLVPGDLHGRPLARAIPGAGLTVVPAFGHEVPQLRPDLVMDAVERILEADAG